MCRWRKAEYNQVSHLPNGDDLALKKKKKKQQKKGGNCSRARRQWGVHLRVMHRGGGGLIEVGRRKRK